LGDAFLNKYYTAFDFHNKRVAFALAAVDSQDRCTADLNLDITHVHDDNDDNNNDDVAATPTNPIAPPPVAAAAPVTSSSSPIAAESAPVAAPVAVVTAPTTTTTTPTTVSFSYTPPSATTTTVSSSYTPPSAETTSDQNNSARHNFGLVSLLFLGFMVLISVIQRRKKNKKQGQAEKFQEMVRHAETYEGDSSMESEEGQGDLDFTINVQTLHKMN
jgi:hypothetical protein